MNKLVFVAAAFAAGVTSFAAFAASGDRNTSYLDAPRAIETKEPAKAAHPEPKAATAKAGKTVKEEPPKRAASRSARKSLQVKSTKRAGSAKPVKAAANATAKPRKERIAAAAPKAKGRQTMVIDPAKGTLTDLSPTPDVVSSSAASGVRYETIVARYAASYGVPVGLAHAVISVESNYRADARGSAGEIGLMQIKPSTARMMGYTGSSQGLFNPETNIRYGMKYLGMAHKLGGATTCGTILRYNAGHAATRMNPISSSYCSKVKRLLAGA